VAKGNFGCVIQNRIQYPQFNELLETTSILMETGEYKNSSYASENKGASVRILTYIYVHY